MKAILFDLDDTLINEADYVRSGHVAISREIAKLSGCEESDVFRSLRYDYLKWGRSGAFDRITEKSLKSQDAVPQLVQTYRNHIPDIQLDRETVEMLQQLKGMFKLAVVTDGNAVMQSRKVEVLGLDRLVDAVVYTWKEGFKKPDPGGFQLALERLGVAPKNAVIIGDDPINDVEAAASAGIHCIRLRQYRFAEIETVSRPDQYFEISAISDLPAVLDTVWKPVR